MAGIEGLEKVQWAGGSMGKDCGISFFQYEPMKYIPLEAHNSTTKGMMCTEISLATLFGPITIKWPNTHMRTKYTLLHASAQSATEINFDPLKG